MRYEVVGCGRDGTIISNWLSQVVKIIGLYQKRERGESID